MIFIQLIVMPDERPDDLVPAEYVARRFACSVSSVYAGKCGTQGVRPVSRDPWRAVRAQVDAELAKLASPPDAAPKKRPSLVRRRARRGGE